MCEQDQATVPVREAVGLVLGHDITEIDPRTGFKGCRFRRGHVITEQDIPKLLDLGKENIYALDISPGKLHEDDAVRLLATALAGKNTHFVPEPREGKLSIIASISGLLKIDVAALERFNSVGEVMCATRHTNTMVAAGDVVAGTRAIPLIADEGLVDEAAGIARQAEGIIKVKPLAGTSVALVITGNEVYTGRIKDAFEPVIREKVAALGSSVDQAVRCPDDITVISAAIERLHREGAGLIILTGGMSVDPDDVTLAAARAAGVEIKFYGSPVLPGAMFMSGCFADGVPVLGVPACGIHHPRTVLDLVLPRALAGEIVEGKEMARLGHGGLCLDCPDCRFPVCPFGKSQ
jgi:molybdopterin biosynthesis enzyme